MYTVSILVALRIENPIFEVYFENFSFCLSALSKLEGGVAFSSKIPIKYDICIVDYGSISSYKDKIQQLVTQYNVNYTYVSSAMWSRARALNHAIDLCAGERAFIIDADTVLPADYIKHHLSSCYPKIYTVSLVYDSGKAAIKSDSYNDLRKQAGRIRPVGYSHFSAPVRWLKQHKFNNDYVGWGGEDDDIVLRLDRDGFKRKMVPYNPVHLYHAPYADLMKNYGKEEWYKKTLAENRRRYWKSRGRKK